MQHDRDLAHRAWRRAAHIRRLSDDLVRVGPVKLGVDGVIAWIPVAGTAWSLGAGALLIREAVAARASQAVVTRMLVWLGLDTLSSGVPVVGWAVDTFFRGHAMAARALMRDIERRHGRPPDPDVIDVVAGAPTRG